MLGTTVDGLLDGEVPAIAQETIEVRRQLTRWLATLVALFILYLIVNIVDVAFMRGEWNHTAHYVCSGIRITLAAASIPVAKRIREITRGRELGDAVSIMMFVEGYPEGQEPPDDALYRVVLTNLPAFLTVLYVLIVVVCIAVALL